MQMQTSELSPMMRGCTVISDLGDRRASSPPLAPTFAVHCSSRICFSPELGSFSLINGSSLLLNCFLLVFTKQNED